MSPVKHFTPPCLGHYSGLSHDGFLAITVDRSSTCASLLRSWRDFPTDGLPLLDPCGITLFMLFLRFQFVHTWESKKTRRFDSVINHLCQDLSNG